MTTKIKHVASNAITTAELDTSSLDSHFSGGTGVTYSGGAISIGQAVHSTDSPTFADLTITGNLNITGNIDQYNVTDLDVTDKTITLGSGQIEANSGGSGIIVDGSGASILWDETNTEWDFNSRINVSSAFSQYYSIRESGTQYGFIGQYKTLAGTGTDTSLTIFSETGDGINFAVNGSVTKAVVIDADGKVGIGETSPDYKLHIKGSGSAAQVQIESTNSTNGQLIFRNTSAPGSGVTGGFHVGLLGDTSGDALLYHHNAKNIQFWTSAARKMTLDSSGNLLVGTTSNSVYNDASGTGIALNAGEIQIAGTGTPLYANRQGSNGEIINLRKDGGTVGSIGAYNGVPYIGYAGGAGGGIMFNGASIEPTALGSSRTDGANDIGSVNYRWRNLYLSGTISSGAITSSSLFTNTYANGNVSAPSTSDHTAGTRQVYYDTNATSWYARGIESSTLWDNTDDDWKLYRQAALRLHWDESAGTFSVNHGTPIVRLADTSSSGAMEMKVDGIAAYVTNKSTNGGLYLQTNNPRDQYVHINGTAFYSESFALNNGVQYDFDIDVGSEGGSGNSFFIIAGYNHFYNTQYGAHKIAFMSARTTSMNTMINVGDQSSTGGGAWQFTKPSSGVLRVRKTAGTYVGGGHGFITVIFKAL